MFFKSLCLSLPLLLGSLVAAAQGPPYPYTVVLTWTLSTSAITGQNVYRAPLATSCGTFSKITATPISATAVTYTDSTIAVDTGYCYEMTAIGTNNQESGPSNVYQVQIPPAPDTNLGGSVP